jgi:hypothetical protein
MNNYIIISTNEYNGIERGLNIFYAAPIWNGEHKGNFATSLPALQDFPDIFQNIDYIIDELSLSDFDPYIPPTLSTLRVAIPDYWWSLFPDDEFILNGYVVQFERVNGILAVDIAYLNWPAFQEELDKPENAAIKRHMMPIWDYVLIQIENHNFI